MKDFSNHYRCIAIDHLGFGLSEKIDSATARPNGAAFIKQQQHGSLPSQNLTLHLW